MGEFFRNIWDCISSAFSTDCFGKCLECPGSCTAGICACLGVTCIALPKTCCLCSLCSLFDCFKCQDTNCEYFCCKTLFESEVCRACDENCLNMFSFTSHVGDCSTWLDHLCHNSGNSIFYCCFCFRICPNSCLLTLGLYDFAYTRPDSKKQNKRHNLIITTQMKDVSDRISHENETEGRQKEFVITPRGNKMISPEMDPMLIKEDTKITNRFSQSNEIIELNDGYIESVREKENLFQKVDVTPGEAKKNKESQ